MISFHKLRIFAATVLVFFICFFKWEPFGSPYTNVTFLSFFFYFSTCLFTYRRSFSLKYIKPYLIPALGSWIIIFVVSMINYVPETLNAFSQIRQFLMQLIFFLIFYNELVYNPKLRDKLLHVFIFSLVFLSIFFLLRIGVEFKDGRLVIFGVNANLLGFWFALTIPILIRFILENKVKGFRKLFYILLIPIFIFLMALTGSRGAAITLALAIATYFTFIKQSFESKVLILIIGIVVAAIAFVAILQVDIMQERFLQQTDDDNLGYRLPIWEACLEIFSEHPFFGVGTTLYEVEIYQRLNDYRVPHNEYLSFLVYGGLSAFTALIVLLINLIRSAWRANIRHNSPLALTFMFTFLINFFVAGGLVYTFVTWFIFAYVAASGTSLKTQGRKFSKRQLLRAKRLAMTEQPST